MWFCFTNAFATRSYVDDTPRGGQVAWGAWFASSHVDFDPGLSHLSPGRTLAFVRSLDRRQREFIFTKLQARETKRGRGKT